MRRKDKQITDQRLLEDILKKNSICRIAFVDGERPYIIPMNYGYEGNEIFVHSALEGKKIDLLHVNNNVCVEITDSIDVVTSEKACDSGTKFRSVICQGTIHNVIENEKKIEGLKIIMRQITENTNWDIPEAAVEKVAVLKVKIETMTGKISGS
ncbi:MAG: pyridoxamine 5'-phosphate oxidase family protein [Spirochaetales bacterium]|nr:pyridoxamine 5'-phosphate oxidase family protein [Spirochaetales bacterium]